MDKIDLSVDYPARVAQQLKEGLIDIALMPVAAIVDIPGARIVSNYGIAAEGNVVSVALFSQSPIEEIDTVILDYQSRTSVRLTQLLLEEFWQKQVEFVPAGIDFIEQIKGRTAGVIIGDRALLHLPNFAHRYDLSAVWQQHTGLPFVFAAWVANKDLPEDFIQEFDAANALGLQHLDEIAAANEIPYYDLRVYYKENVVYFLDEEKKKALSLFLDKIKQKV